MQQRKQDYLGSVAASEHGHVKVAEADAAVQQADAHAATRRLEIQEKYQNVKGKHDSYELQLI